MSQQTPPSSSLPTVVITGGGGFVASHLARFLAAQYRVVLVDIRPPRAGTPHESYVCWDVRTAAPLDGLPARVDCIVNLAAVHTSPGHPAHEYFETNILGARNVCGFAEAVGCERIVFTSSISVYGAGEDEKNEDSLFMPNIPYGVSKTVAEYIHREWLLKGPAERKLAIIRPAVVFGKGEGGNFTRIATALRKGFFAYPGRKDTIKSWIYVKDLCRLIVERMAQSEPLTFFNAAYPQKTTTEDICKAFNQTMGYKLPSRVVPLVLLNAGAGVLRIVNTPVIRSLGLDPARIVKLVRSTNISSQKVLGAGFRFRYDLLEALSDWAKECEGGELR
jgi:nucleoside-diphosphate-sugar epimerase